MDIIFFVYSYGKQGKNDMKYLVFPSGCICLVLRNRNGQIISHAKTVIQNINSKILPTEITHIVLSICNGDDEVMKKTYRNSALWLKVPVRLGEGSR